MTLRKNTGIENKVWSLTLLIILLPVCSFGRPALAIESIRSVSVSGSVGQNRITLFGFGPPLCRIELSSARVFATTVSRADGYFVFDRTLLPKNPSDLCISAVDDNQRLSQPVCIPPPPPANYHTDIGPVILPPTISLDQDQIQPNATVAASGQSLPNANITVYLFQKDSHPFIFVPSAQAFSLPILSLISDAQGNFSFNLPTAYSTDYRLFSAVSYQNNPSSGSNTLAFSLPSLWQLFWLRYSWLIITLPLFLATLVLFFWLLIKNHRSVRYLPAVFSYPLVKINHRDQK